MMGHRAVSGSGPVPALLSEYRLVWHRYDHQFPWEVAEVSYPDGELGGAIVLIGVARFYRPELAREYLALLRAKGAVVK